MKPKAPQIRLALPTLNHCSPVTVDCRALGTFALESVSQEDSYEAQQQDRSQVNKDRTWHKVT